MLGYDDIKRLAKQVSIPVTELLALSPKNDPFYAGTPAARRDAEWFAEIWQRAGYDRTGAHLRKVHYWTLSHSEEEFTVMPNGNPYQNTQLCWGFLTQASKMARYLGLVDITNPIGQKMYDLLSSMGVVMQTIAVNQDESVEIYANVDSFPERRELRRRGVDVVKYPDWITLDSDAYDHFVLKFMELV